MKFEKRKTMKVLKLVSPCCVSVVKRSKELLHIDTPEPEAQFQGLNASVSISPP